MVSVACFVTPSVAEIVAELVTFTDWVWIEKLPLFLSLGMMRLAGTTLALGLSDERATVTLATLFGTTPVRVTVPLALVPPRTLTGLRVSAATAGSVVAEASFEASEDPPSLR